MFRYRLFCTGEVQGCISETREYAKAEGKFFLINSFRLNYSVSDPDPLQETLIWIRVAKINRDKLAYK